MRWLLVVSAVYLLSTGSLWIPLLLLYLAVTKEKLG